MGKKADDDEDECLGDDCEEKTPCNQAKNDDVEWLAQCGLTDEEIDAELEQFIMSQVESGDAFSIKSLKDKFNKVKTQVNKYKGLLNAEEEQVVYAELTAEE